MSGLSKLLLAGRQCDVRAGESVERAAHSNNVIHSQILCQNINFLTWTRKTDVKSGFDPENQSQNTGKYENFGTLGESVSEPKSGKAKTIAKTPKYKSNFLETSTRGEKILGGMADGWSRISELFFTG